MRNPNWHEDEIILALALYFSPDRGSIDVRNSKIIELSDLLRQLPIVQGGPTDSFRNPNGVCLKLSNFLAIDPTYKGKGMERGSKLDEKLFKLFYHDTNRLTTVAESIRSISKNPTTKALLNKIELDDDFPAMEIVEGQILYRYHKLIERDKRIVKRKKDYALKKYGSLTCEVCSFDFSTVYGQIGSGFIECHHKTPLSQIQIGTNTTLNDLALVCSNCHRMLHRKANSLTIEGLKLNLRKIN